MQKLDPILKSQTFFKYIIDHKFNLRRIQCK